MFSIYVLCLIIFCLKLKHLFLVQLFSATLSSIYNGLFLGFFRSTAVDTKLTTEQNTYVKASKKCKQRFKNKTTGNNYFNSSSFKILKDGELKIGEHQLGFDIPPVGAVNMYIISPCKTFPRDGY